MSLSPSRSAQQLREQLTAKRTLERMTKFEGLAVESVKATADALRRSFAERYRRLIGVDPSRRQEFRSALERIRAGGRMPVQDVLEVLNGPDK